MNSNILKAQIKLNNDTLNDLSKYLGVSLTTLSYKINEKTEFSREEIKRIKDKYSLTAEQIDEIFFT